MDPHMDSITFQPIIPMVSINQSWQDRQKFEHEFVAEFHPHRLVSRLSYLAIYTIIHQVRRYFQKHSINSSKAMVQSNRKYDTMLHSIL